MFVAEGPLFDTSTSHIADDKPKCVAQAFFRFSRVTLRKEIVQILAAAWGE